jgi:predicted dehydrogenase/threonine dehydrogenase-like Zn-dependent dehydrogenase
MKQVVQQISDGKTLVHELPCPRCAAGEVLVAEAASLISAGTERYVVDLARKNLLQKAKARPDHVARVIQKIRQEGLTQTITQVRAKLDEPMPLGYSTAGTVIACGSDVQAFKPGDRVAAAAPHASVVSVGHNLCAAIPAGVSFENAAYAGVGAVAMQGVRLAKLSLGERVLVIGLGLIGQITVGLLKAHGCRVFGTDLDPSKLELARTFGMDEGQTGLQSDAVRRFSHGVGVDAVLITAATDSNAPIEFAADLCRAKGRIVLVGVAGLNLPRPPFFQKELEFTVSSSLGPGRGDVAYEEKGVDYPIGYARWTAQRNMDAVLDLIAAGKLPVDRLTTHRFAVDAAAAAYNLVAEKTEPHLGIILQYQEEPPSPVRRVELRTKPLAVGSLGLSLIGAGNFARLVMMPALAKQTGIHFRGICTAKGLNAVHTGEKFDFAFATTDTDEIFNDDQTSAVIVATRHHLHADLVIAALRAGKHVFVEKPLCIDAGELRRVSACVEELGDGCPLLTVGFNRRFAPAMAQLRRHFDRIAPMSVSYRFAPGEMPASAWPQDPAVGGGRIIGEACHAIDACVALTNSVPVRVFAESVAKVGGIETTDDRVFITMRHANGAISSVSYQAGGDRSGPAERIEIFGGGRTAVVENWNTVEMWAGNRRTTANGHKDKGHFAGLGAFVDACRKGGEWPIIWSHLHGTSWATLAAVTSLRTGQAVDRDTSLDDAI